MGVFFSVFVLFYVPNFYNGSINCDHLIKLSLHLKSDMSCYVMNVPVNLIDYML